MPVNLVRGVRREKVNCAGHGAREPWPRIGRFFSMDVLDQEDTRLGPWAQGAHGFRAIVVVNERAGSVARDSADQLVAQLRDLGGDVAGVFRSPEEIEPAAAKGADLVVVLGGDGTARAAAEMFGAGPALVLLPGGTMNVLPQALYGSRSWPEALAAAIGHGRIARLVAGDANGKRFFIAAFFGAPTLLARVREAVRDGHLRVAWRRLQNAFQRAFARRLAVRVANGSAARAEAFGVLCPPYNGAIEGQALEWVRLNWFGVSDMVRVGLRSVIGAWRDDPSVDFTRNVRGEVRSPGFIPAILDGEPVMFFSRVDVSMRRDGPRVIVVD